MAFENFPTAESTPPTPPNRSDCGATTGEAGFLVLVFAASPADSSAAEGSTARRQRASAPAAMAR